MRAAILDGAAVINVVVVADAAGADLLGAIICPETVGIGWSRDAAGDWHPPAPPVVPLADLAASAAEIMRAAASAAITSGFASAALGGAARRYGSTDADQANLLRAVMVGGGTAVASRAIEAGDGEGEPWSWIDHTSAQLDQLLADLDAHIAAVRARLAARLAAIAAAPDAASLAAIGW